MKHQMSWDANEFPLASALKEWADGTKIKSKFTRILLLTLETALQARPQTAPPVNHEPQPEQPQPTQPVTMDEELAAALKGWQL